jgi:hypothetical protein
LRTWKIPAGPNPLTLDRVNARVQEIEQSNFFLPSGARARREPVVASSSRVICSLADEVYLAPLAATSLTFEAYARRHGWDMVLRVGALADDRPISWSKIPLIKQLLESYEEVWWIDADAAVVDLEPDIRNELEPGKDLYLTEHRWDEPAGRRCPNAGVLFVRRSDASLALLDAIWHQEHRIHHPWWENTALLDLLGYGVPDDGTPPFPGPPTCWTSVVKLLGLEWNSTENASRSTRPVIRHLGRRPTPTALTVELIDEINRSAVLGGV